MWTLKMTGCKKKKNHYIKCAEKNTMGQEKNLNNK